MEPPDFRAYSKVSSLDAEFLEGLKFRSMPTKFQYIGGEQTRRWLDLCGSPEYVYHNETLALLSRIRGTVVGEIGDRTNVIAVGAGDGLKEIQLMEESHRQAKCVGFFPVDLSSELLAVALDNSEHLEIRKESFENDLSKHLPSISGYVRDAYYPRHLVTMLGNTLGNYEQDEVFMALRASVQEDDLLLLGVAVKSTGRAPGRRGGGLRLKHSFGVFLDRVGLDPGDGETEVEEAPHHCFPSVVTSRQYFVLKRDRVLRFRGETVEVKKGERILMGFSNSYEEKGFREILRRYGFDVVQAFRGAHSIKVLCTVRA